MINGMARSEEIGREFNLLSWADLSAYCSSLERKIIQENWGPRRGGGGSASVTWSPCFVSVASPHTVRPSVVRQCFFLEMESCKFQLNFLFSSFKIQSSSCKEQWQWFDSWQQIVIKQVLNQLDKFSLLFWLFSLLFLSWEGWDCCSASMFSTVIVNNDIIGGVTPH